MRHRMRSAALLVLVALAAVGLPVVTAAPAGAAEIYSRPASGVWTVSGHGFGHGTGMSAWGSYGAAQRGLSYRDILAFYYPGTSQAIQGNASIRVSLTTDTGQARVSAVSGLTVTDGSGYSTVLPPGPTQWRMVPSLRGFHLESLTDIWRVVPLNGQTEITTSVRFDSPTGVVRAWKANGSATDYRGALVAYPAGSSVTSVLHTTVEDYLRGVVSREAIPSWPAEALRAQAVASRTIAYYFRSKPQSSVNDICDTTQCQVFGGIASYSASGSRTGGETATTDAAVSATTGVMLTYQGAVAVAMYSSSSGGYTTSGGVPYLPAQPDPYDGAAPNDPQHSWTATIRASDLERAFPSIGVLQTISVEQRDGRGDWGGRVMVVTLTGSAGSVRTTGYGVMNARPYPANADGIRSNWWTLGSPAGGAPPIGSLDSTSWDGARLRVAGWAIDPDVTAPVDVHVYLDGNNVAQVSAAAARPDVAGVYPYYGPNHGYVVSLTAAPGPHVVCAYAINVPAPANNPQLGCRSVDVPNQRPIGQVDTAGWDGANAIRVTGWTIDPDTNAALLVHAYVDGRFAGEVRAERDRQDVGAVYPLYGPAHGYEMALTTGPGTHSVCLYAINLPAPADNPQLGCRTVTLPTTTPIGQLDSTVWSGAQVRLTGWTIDPDTTAPISVQAFVDGSFAGMVTAGWPRSDVASVYPYYGSDHGFDATLSLGPGPHVVCVYAVNIPGPGIDPQLGCRRSP